MVLLAEREIQILNIINDNGTVVVRELAKHFDVTEATIRRDLQRMEDQALLRRTHGGAVKMEAVASASTSATLTTAATLPATTHEPDALIIAPVNNRAVHTLRERAIRNDIPFLAESMAQDGAIYLGPDNYRAGYDLGIWTGEYIHAHFDVAPIVLDVTQMTLTNTQARSRGFVAGLRHVLRDGVRIITVDCNGLYDQAYQVVQGALRSNPDVNVLFGINDDTILASMQAYEDLRHTRPHMLAVNVGGEGQTILDALTQPNILQACMALFPEVVGRVGVDVTCAIWQGEPVPDVAHTPHRLLTPATVPDWYEQAQQGWVINPQQLATLIGEELQAYDPIPGDKLLSFVIHYRTHEWYQNVASAMQARAHERGIRFSVQDLQANIAAEIRDLRRLIGKLAASYVQTGDTIIMDHGATALAMAHFLAHRKQITIITNSFAVFQKLHTNAHLRLILTGGDYDPETGALTGRGAELLLKEVRADKLFLVAGGLSQAFGISSVTMQEADVRRTMIQSSREVIALADHTVLDIDSNVSVASLDVVDTLITDAGIAPAHEFALLQRGVQVISAGRV